MGTPEFCFISYQAGGLYEATSYCFGFGGKKECIFCRAGFASSRPGAGPSRSVKEEGPSSSTPLCPAAQGGTSHLNRKLCQKTRSADTQRPGPLSRQAGSSAVSPANPGSEKVKANISFPLRRIQIFPPPQKITVSPSTVRTGLLALRAGKKGQVLVLFFVLKINIPFKMMRCLRGGKVVGADFCPCTCDLWRRARGVPPLPASGPAGRSTSPKSMRQRHTSPSV